MLIMFVWKQKNIKIKMLYQFNLHIEMPINIMNNDTVYNYGIKYLVSCGVQLCRGRLDLSEGGGENCFCPSKI